MDINEICAQNNNTGLVCKHSTVGGMAWVHLAHVKQYSAGLDTQMVHIKWPKLLQTAIHSTQDAALCTKASHLKCTLANYPRAKTKII